MYTYTHIKYTSPLPPSPSPKHPTAQDSIIYCPKGHRGGGGGSNHHTLRPPHLPKYFYSHERDTAQNELVTQCSSTYIYTC